QRSAWTCSVDGRVSSLLASCLLISQVLAAFAESGGNHEVRRCVAARRSILVDSALVRGQSDGLRSVRTIARTRNTQGARRENPRSVARRPRLARFALRRHYVDAEGKGDWCRCDGGQ